MLSKSDLLAEYQSIADCELSSQTVLAAQHYLSTQSYFIAEIIAANRNSLVFRATRQYSEYSEETSSMEVDCSNQVAIKMTICRNIQFLEQMQREFNNFYQDSNCKSKRSTLFVESLFFDGENECLFTVMQLCERGDLHSFISTQSQESTAEDLFKIGKQIVDSIDDLHEDKIYHGDINLSNFLMSNENKLILSFLQCSKFLFNSPNHSQAQQLPNTMFYSSIQRIQGRQETFIEDIYSVGVILLELCGINIQANFQILLESVKENDLERLQGSCRTDMIPLFQVAKRLLLIYSFYQENYERNYLKEASRQIQNILEKGEEVQHSENKQNLPIQEDIQQQQYSPLSYNSPSSQVSEQLNCLEENNISSPENQSICNESTKRKLQMEDAFQNIQQTSQSQIFKKIIEVLQFLAVIFLSLFEKITQYKIIFRSFKSKKRYYQDNATQTTNQIQLTDNQSAEIVLLARNNPQINPFSYEESVQNLENLKMQSCNSNEVAESGKHFQYQSSPQQIPLECITTQYLQTEEEERQGKPYSQFSQFNQSDFSKNDVTEKQQRQINLDDLSSGSSDIELEEDQEIKIAKDPSPLSNPPQQFQNIDNITMSNVPEISTNQTKQPQLKVPLLRLSEISKSNNREKTQKIRKEISLTDRIDIHHAASHSTSNFNFNNSSNIEKNFDIIVFPNGYFIGEVFNKQPHGEGKMYFHKGNRYEGSFKQGLYQGYGCYYYCGGNRYSGQWDHNIRQGEGIYQWANGTTYTGHYWDNLKSGQGILQFTSGERYEGEFQQNAFHGQGKYYFTDGTYFSGIFHKGVRLHGNFYLSNGDLVTDNQHHCEIPSHRQYQGYQHQHHAQSVQSNQE